MSNYISFFGRTMLSKQVMIFVSGKAGVGKSTTAKILKRALNARGFNAVIKSFGDEVKKEARIKGWDGKKDDVGRRLLQEIGDGYRDSDPDIWVKKLDNTIAFEEDIIIIDDWRYPNEVEYFEEMKSFQIIKIRVESPEREMLRGKEEYNNRSETSLPLGTQDSELYDIIIYNIGNIFHLEDDCKKLVNYLLEDMK